MGSCCPLPHACSILHSCTHQELLACLSHAACHLSTPSFGRRPAPRSSHQAVAHRGYLYIFGGELMSPNQACPAKPMRRGRGQACLQRRPWKHVSVTGALQGLQGLYGRHSKVGCVQRLSCAVMQWEAA